MYDALTSPRVYKPAIPHSKAVEMILDGQCGVFNPLLMECLTEMAPKLPEEMGGDTGDRVSRMEMRSVADELHRHEELSASERTLQLLEHERMKFSFFAAMSKEIQFEYTVVPPMITLNTWGANRLGLKETVMDPIHSESVLHIMDAGTMASLSQALQATSPAQPVVKFDCRTRIGEEDRWTRIIARATWSSDEPPQYTGAIGKAIEIGRAHV